jgi:hypothetical protein
MLFTNSLMPPFRYAPKKCLKNHKNVKKQKY